MRAFSRSLAGLFLFFLIDPLFAAPSEFKEFLATETQIHQHEQSLSKMASGLEDWLSGRSKRAVLLGALDSVQQQISDVSNMPSQLRKPVESSESSMVKLAKDFANSESPDSEGQRRLFLGMSKQTQMRTLALLDWRKEAVSGLLKDGLDSHLQETLKWESSWYPLWVKEAEYTQRLQAGLLDQSQGDDSEILKGLLSLRIKAQAIECPAQVKPLHDASLERLTVLARTAEQLLRLEKRKSRGALTRVRRLSRKLTALTKQFQENRLKLLKST